MIRSSYILLLLAMMSFMTLHASAQVGQSKYSWVNTANGKRFLKHLHQANETLKTDNKLNAAYLDSAQSILPLLNSDSARLNYLSSLGKRLKRTAQYDSLKKTARTILALGEKINSNFHKSQALSFYGASCYYTANFDSAAFYYQEAKNISEAMNDSTMVIVNSLGLSLSMMSMERYEETLPVIQELANITEASGDYSNNGYAEYYWAYMLFMLERLDEALIHFKKSLASREKTNDVRGVSNCLISIAAIEAESGNYEACRKVGFEVLPKLRKINNSQGLINTYESIAAASLHLNDLNVAKNYVDSAMALSYKSKMLTGVDRIYLTKGQIEYKQGQYESALNSCQQLIDKEKTNASTANRIAAFEVAAKAALQLGKTEQGIKYFEQSKALTDSLYNSNIEAKILELDKKYELSKTERDLAQKEQLLAEKDLALSKSKIQWLITFGSGLIMVLLFLFFFRAYKLKSKAKKKQEKLNEELKSSNAKLKELNIEKNNLIGIVAHDLKSPFHNIIGLTQVLEAKSTLNAEQERILEMIRNSAYSVEGMINHILDLNKIESNLLNLDLSPVNLSNISKLIVERFQFTADKKKIALKSDIDEEVFALANENYFNQVVENILSNAFKFSNSNSEVEITLKDFEDHVLLEIKDNGPGISTEFQDKIFEQNVTGNAKPTGNEDSTGIGLAIVKRFVDSMGGDVWFDSELGKGTRFFVKLKKAA